MQREKTTRKQIFARALGSILILGIFLQLPSTAEAQLGAVAGAITGGGNIPTEESGAIKRKEVTNAKKVGIGFIPGVSAGASISIPIPGLDAIAWKLAKVIVQQMTQNLVGWINGGYNGKPLFATDPEKFFLDIGDHVAGDYIQSIGAGALCSPFKLQIQNSIKISYNRSKLISQGRTPTQGTCTLSGSAANIQAFFDGDFDKGGWDQWYNMTQVSGNNPYGAIADASGELSIKINGTKSIELAKLNWGQGFIGWSDCVEKDKNGVCTKNGPTKTPGTVINAELKKRLGSNIDQLNLADEMDEVVSAVFGQLVSKYIGGGKGLFPSTATAVDENTSNPSAGTGGGNTGSGAQLPATLTILLFDPNPVDLAYGDSYIEPGYEALDPVDGSLTDNVSVVGADSINPQVPGTYSITYTVTNSQGDTVSQNRTVIVAQPVTATPGPTVP